MLALAAGRQCPAYQAPILRGLMSKNGLLKKIAKHRGCKPIPFGTRRHVLGDDFGRDCWDHRDDGRGVLWEIALCPLRPAWAARSRPRSPPTFVPISKLKSGVRAGKYAQVPASRGPRPILFVSTGPRGQPSA